MDVGLEWARQPGAEGCISAEELRSRTRAQVPASVHLTLDADETDFVVVGDVAPTHGGFRVAFALRDARDQSLGERTFEVEARSCRAVDDALVLALALLVETPRVIADASARPEAPLDELAPALRARPSDPAIAPVRLSPRAPRPWRFEVGLAANVGYGRTPTVTAGPSVVGVVVPPGLVPLMIRGGAYPFASPRSTVPGEGVVVRGAEGGLDVCPIALERRSTEVRACGGAHVAALFASPRGPLSTAGRLIFPTFPLRAELRHWFGPVAPFVAIDGWLSPTTPSFLYRDAAGQARTSFRVALLTGSIELGLLARFGP